MANSVKYNTSAESLALNTGDFWIGTGDVAKGPTFDGSLIIQGSAPTNANVISSPTNQMPNNYSVGQFGVETFTQGAIGGGITTNGSGTGVVLSINSVTTPGGGWFIKPSGIAVTNGGSNWSVGDEIFIDEGAINAKFAPNASQTNEIVITIDESMLTAGFWSAINPSNIDNDFADGYTIYVNKAIQGPSIRVASSDAELITITNQISGNSYATINDCFDYFLTQGDKFVLNSYINPIITDGLVLALDAGLVPSYPRNETTWYDLSGEGNNATLVDGPTFNSLGAIDFDGSNYGTADSVTSDLVSSDFTFMASIKGGTQSHKSILTINTSGGGNRVLWMVFNAGMGVNDNGTWYYGTIDVDDDEWHNVVLTYNFTTKNAKIYTDGVENLNVTTGNQIGIQSSDLASIAMEWDGVTPSDLFNGKIAQVQVYDKELTENEILQNYYQAPIVTDGLVFAVDPGNLVSYENGSTTTYSLVGTDTGTLTGGVVFNGGNGGVWGFDGTNDYIAVSNLGLSSHTIEGWINSSDGSQGGTGASTIVTAIGDYSGGAADKYTYIGFLGNNKLTYRIDNLISSHLLVADYTYTADQWYHVALSYDSGTGVTVAYLNGNSIGSITSTTGLTFDSVPFNIAQSDYNNQSFDGLVGPVRAYDKALTAGEVAQNYGAEKGRFSNVSIAPQA